jgi:hypothetical protein
MDDPSLNSAKPISPISQLLKNLGMTRDDLTRHSDQMRQFLTAQNANSLRAFSNAEAESDADAESVKSPTMLPRALRAKSRSISAADAPPPPSFPPATPIKTEPDELTASSSVRRFESMDEIIERQNRRSKRERRSRREREASPVSIRLRDHPYARRAILALQQHATRVTWDAPGRWMILLPSNTGFLQVGHPVILANSACVPPPLRLLAILCRIHCHVPPHPVEWAAITGILSSIRPSLPSTVTLLVFIVPRQQTLMVVLV